MKVTGFVNLAACVAIIGTGGAATGQQATFILRAKASSTVVTSGAELVVTVSTKNLSAETIWIPAVQALDEGSLHYKISVVDEKGQPAHLTAYGSRPTSLDLNNKFERVRPQETFTDEVVITRLFDITVPHTYTIRVSTTIAWLPPIVSAEPLKVTVLPNCGCPPRPPVAGGIAGPG